MSYWSYYLAWTFFAYALRQPWLLAGVAVFLLLRKVIPDPRSLFRAFSRSGALRSQVEVNAANVTARRDLAQIYLDVRRPRAALKLVEQALARTPDEPEMLYLAGLALQRCGRNEEALPRLVRAVELDPRVRFGQPYLVAGDALLALGRNEEAVDAYERYSETNSSDVGGYLRLARSLARSGKLEAARAAVAEAKSTWRVLPSRMRQRTFFKGFFGPWWARVTVLREPAAILVALALAGAVVAGGVALYPEALGLLKDERTPRRLDFDGMQLPPSARKYYAAVGRCGSQRTGDFAGRYVVVEMSHATLRPDATDEQRKAAEDLAHEGDDQYKNFEIASDRIRSGVTRVQEFCLTKVLEVTHNRLHAEALWHEDVRDPGDASVIEIRLTRDGDRVKFALFDPDEPPELEIATLKRADQ